MRIMWVVLIALTTVRAQVNPNQGVESIVPVIDSSLPTDNTIVDGNSMGSSTTTTATTATTLLSKKTGSTVTTVGTDTTTGADVTATFTTTIGDSSDNKTPVMMVPNCELETIEQFQAEAGAL